LFKDNINNLKVAVKYLEGATTIRKEYTSSDVEAHCP